MTLKTFNSTGGFSTGDNLLVVIDENGNVVAPVIGNAQSYIYGDGSNIAGVTAAPSSTLIADGGTPAAAFLDSTATLVWESIGGNLGEVGFDVNDTSTFGISSTVGNLVLFADTNTANVGWNFGSDGKFTLPFDGSIYGQEDSSITINARNIGNDVSAQILNWNSSNIPTSIISVEPSDIVFVTNVDISPHQMTFDNTGNLFVPGSINMMNNVAWWNYAPGEFTLSANTVTDISGLNIIDAGLSTLYAGTDVVLQANLNGGILEWRFGANGFLTLPGNYTLGEPSGPNLELKSPSNRYGINVTWNQTTGVNVTPSDITVTSASGWVINVTNYGTGYTDGTNTDVGTSGSTGTGMTVDFTATSGVIDTGSIVINNPGVNYLPGDVITISGGNNNATFTLVDVATTNTWTFDSSGNIRLPLTTSSINYPNGTPYGGGGGSVSQLTYGPNSFALDEDGNVIFQGATPGEGVDRGVVWDFGQNDGGTNSEIRQDNSGLTVRGYTSNNFGNAAVNIVTNAGAAEKTWRFDEYGNVQLAGNVYSSYSTTSIPFDFGISNITTGNATVVVTLVIDPFPGPVVGQVYISGVLGTTEANGIWWYEAQSPDSFQLFYDQALTTPVDGTTWTAYLGGGNAVDSGLNDLITATNNFVVQASSQTFSMNIDGSLSLTHGSKISEVPSPIPGNFALALQGSNLSDPDQQLLVYPTFVDANHLHLTSGNLYSTELYLGNDNLYVKLANTGNVIINTDDSFGNTAQWTFDIFGAINLPVNDPSIQVANNYPTIIAYGSGGHGGPEFTWYNSDNLDDFGNSTFLRNTMYFNNDGLYVGFNEDDNVGQYVGNFRVNSNGDVVLPVTNVNGSEGEAAKFVGTRKIVGGLEFATPYAVTLNAGGTPTVAYTASAGTQSVKVTFVTQSNGAEYQWEQFDVVAVVSQNVPGAVNYVVSNRVKANANVPDTVVTATMNGTQIEISLTLDAVQTSGGWANHSSTEFGLMVD